VEVDETLPGLDETLVEIDETLVEAHETLVEVEETLLGLDEPLNDSTRLCRSPTRPSSDRQKVSSDPRRLRPSPSQPSSTPSRVLIARRQGLKRSIRVTFREADPTRERAGPPVAAPRRHRLQGAGAPSEIAGAEGHRPVSRTVFRSQAGQARHRSDGKLSHGMSPAELSGALRWA
jgi:hypothetical protein